MKKLAILMLVASLTLTGCASTDSPINEIAKTTNVMLDMRDDYELARYQLQLSIDRFPAEVGVELLDLETEISAYIEDVQHKWKKDELSTLLTIDAIYREGSQLYSRGVILITPHVDLLEPAARQQLQDLAETASRVSDTYRQLREDLQNVTQQTEMARSSMELMTLMLRLGVLAK